MGREGTYLNIIKAIYDKPTANITFNIIFKAENLPAKFKNETRMPILPILNQQSTGSPSHSNETKKKKNNNNIKDTQSGREEVKLSLL